MGAGALHRVHDLPRRRARHEPLRREQGRAVTVNALAPSLVRSKGTIEGPHEELGLFEMLAQAQAIKRTQLPSDLVGALSFLASDEAGFITGQTLVVDGGWVRA